MSTPLRKVEMTCCIWLSAGASMLLLPKFIGNTLDLGRTAMLALSPFLMVHKKGLWRGKRRVLTYSRPVL